MNKINVWYFLAMICAGAFLATLNIETWQFAVLFFAFSAFDLVGSPTKPAPDASPSGLQSDKL